MAIHGVTRPGLLRPVLHAGTGLGALLLSVLPHPWALVCGGLGLLAGWVVFPLSGLEARLRRPGEPFFGGLRTYPVAVFGLVLLLPPAEAAAAWGILAFGDAAAAIVGTRVPGPRLLGHPKATLPGTLAHLGVGWGAAWALGAAVGAIGRAAGVVDPGPVPTVAATGLAALAAVCADVLLRLPDDNLPCAAAAGGVLAAVRGLLP
jgi:dolichol kinase